MSRSICRAAAPYQPDRERSPRRSSNNIAYGENEICMPSKSSIPDRHCAMPWDQRYQPDRERSPRRSSNDIASLSASDLTKAAKRKAPLERMVGDARTRLAIYRDGIEFDVHQLRTTALVTMHVANTDAARFRLATRNKKLLWAKERTNTFKNWIAEEMEKIDREAKMLDSKWAAKKYEDIAKKFDELAFSEWYSHSNKAALARTFHLD